MRNLTRRSTGRQGPEQGSKKFVTVAGLLYPVSWIAGLFVFPSSAQVQSSGAALLHADSGHGAALAAQFLLTEGCRASFWPSSPGSWRV